MSSLTNKSYHSMTEGIKIDGYISELIEKAEKFNLRTKVSPINIKKFSNWHIGGDQN